MVNAADGFPFNFCGIHFAVWSGELGAYRGRVPKKGGQPSAGAPALSIFEFCCPGLIFQRERPSRGMRYRCARVRPVPLTTPEGPPRDKQEEVVSAPGPSIDLARAGGAFTHPPLDPPSRAGLLPRIPIPVPHAPSRQPPTHPP